MLPDIHWDKDDQCLILSSERYVPERIVHALFEYIEDVAAMPLGDDWKEKFLDYHRITKEIAK